MGFKEDTELLQAILVLSMFWSMSTCVISHVRGISGCREYFPLPSKIFMGLYAFCAISSRVMAMILFFASPLGLFSLLRHVQFEQIKWYPSLTQHFVDENGYIQFGDGPPILWKNIERLFFHLCWNSDIASAYNFPG